MKRCCDQLFLFNKLKLLLIHLHMCITFILLKHSSIISFKFSFSSESFSMSILSSRTTVSPIFSPSSIDGTELLMPKEGLIAEWLPTRYYQSCKLVGLKKKILSSHIYRKKFRDLFKMMNNQPIKSTNQIYQSNQVNLCNLIY